MRLNYQLNGQGPLVVLIHGLFGSFENLGVIARALQDEFQVLNIDVRNHGRSPQSNDMSYPLLAADLAETLDSLALKPFALLGHSMGGKIAMQYALQNTIKPERLILADIAPVGYPPRHNSIFAGLNSLDLTTLSSRAEADQLLAAFIKEAGVRQFLLKSLDKTETGFRWRFNLDALSTHYQALIGAPVAEGVFDGSTLFIKGGNSDYILAEHRPTILAHFPAAQAKVIEGTGHWLHAEKPAAFNKIVRDFLLS